MSVALGYARLRGDLRCTLDHRPYLPQSWADDEQRREKVGVPPDLRYRPKWKIALEMLQRAQHNRMLPSAPRWLIMARHAITGEIKYFVSNAPPGVPLERIVHVAFCRWHIERTFQDEKDQLGLDHFECRRYQAVQRHLILTAVSHLFLSHTRLQLIEEGQQQGEKNPDPPAGPQSHRCVAPRPRDVALPEACLV